MVVVGLDVGEVDVLEVRVDPRDLRELAAPRVLDEAGGVHVEDQILLERRKQGQLGPVDVGEMAVMPDQVLVVDAAQRADVVRVPAPADIRRVEMADERIAPVDRRWLRLVVAAAGGAAGQRIQAVGPGGAGNGAVPAVAHAEVLGQVVVDGEIRAVVVLHDHARIGVGDVAALERVSEARREPVHLAAADLKVGLGRGVVGIPVRIRDVSGRRVRDRILLAVRRVRHPRLEAVDFVAAVLERQVAEHVVKRPVLQHQHDDVLDVLQTAALFRLAHRLHAPSRDRGCGRRQSSHRD